MARVNLGFLYGGFHHSTTLSMSGIFLEKLFANEMLVLFLAII